MKNCKREVACLYSAGLTAEGASQDRCNSSLGERALGCGRWSSALTEPFGLYVRSLARAPLARSVKRGVSLSKAKAPVVQVQRTHRTIALAARGESPSDPIAFGERGKSPNDVNSRKLFYDTGTL